eukprot:scaffold4988_cov109-Ochromonas_danica.AAC.1
MSPAPQMTALADVIWALFLLHNDVIMRSDRREMLCVMTMDKDLDNRLGLSLRTIVSWST